MAKKKKKPQSKLKYKFTKKLVHLFESHPHKNFSEKEIIQIMGVKSTSDRKLIHDVLIELTTFNIVKAVQRGVYRIAQGSERHNAENVVEGTIDFNQRGAAYLIVDGMEDDIFIHSNNTGKAFHQDKVRVELFKRQGKIEGKVIDVVERKRTEFVGTVDVGKSTVFVRPEESRMPVDFFIEKGHLKNAKHGDKVIVKFLSWPGGSKSPLGGVIERLGKPGNMDVDMNVILAENGFPTHFPRAVELEADAIQEPNYNEEAKKRRDFRKTLTFTIDPIDAKDFDDALSFQELKNGNYEIGIHIADVSHYVTPGSKLDLEAYSRGNSVYLVDRVIPMLPEVLSNKLCSLRPKEEKLTFSAVFEITPDAKVVNEWFGKTVIYSDHRFTYEQAQEIIEGQAENKEFGDVILTMDKVAKILRKKRLQAGALNVESQEVRFELDEKGNPVGLKIKVSKDANKLIEEFMLLANRKVASYIGEPKKGKKVIPFVYRTHDEPDEAKISDLKGFLAEFGYSIPQVKNKPISYGLNQVMEKAKEKDELHIIGPLVIRSMSKAVYETDNIGHYGLAFDYYTHFTSPIRRYADLLVHRILFEQLNGRTYKDSNMLDDWCKHISGTEKSATEAERESIKYMQVKFMEDKVGRTYSGKVTGVTDWGIFVELDETKCEGLLHINNLPGRYVLDTKIKHLVSKEGHENYHLGMAVEVVVKNVDLVKKQMDLILPDDLMF
ncbi:ribonuclease R [Parvicella tangerina]|uniref:Ribonuclease R n=1 Tax=Parvicella tangerina TaxID=2829795 RepID=A0A916NTI3_9FLAO|nr:ribonuclease R [Parvicella tangerina]CAG5085915.1 Ribonuclease R [Parvicella tangerina]